MTTKQIDFLNIGLILVSALLAYFFPLAVFVLSFSILGPLHYLTEINWLDSKRYFTNQKKSIWLIISLFSSLIIVLPKLYFAYPDHENRLLYDMVIFIDHWSNSAIFVSFLLAIGFLYVKRIYGWIALVVIALVGAFLLNDFESYSMVIGMLIPTVIHVYLFTLLFMLFGAAKTKSGYGYFSVLLAMIIPVIFIFIDIDPGIYAFGDEMKRNYIDNGLHVAPVLFAKFYRSIRW